MSMLAQWSIRNRCRFHCRRQLLRTFHSSSSRLTDSKVHPVKGSSENSPNTPVFDEKEGLGSLTRPLGVRERPTTVVKSTTQKLKDLMDTDVRMAQRRHLIKEASKGYFHDLNMTRKHGGKTWIAPKVLIREDKALYLPNISGKSLLDASVKNTTELCYGKVSVVAMLGTKISEHHAKAFTDLTNSRFTSNPHYQYIQINLQENMMKAFLVNLFLSQLRRVIPAEQHSNYLVSGQNMEYVREAIGMTNTKVGYVYLIDENLRIRWAGCADPKADEIRALENCTGVLLNRLGSQRTKAQSRASPKSVEEAQR
ncbi:F1F0 ATP synthase assembly protein Atp10 [Coprinopsis marcescibilis]|uniref:F1F0 ATP synthase assembly protein Atp10 n=1 Tax=Coprinopsis marcescibilis TaxID=230819 RepID=A0A5C3L0Q8_COPMA|nr:F1F0 ATP synthase assembly protein Atp10 [Coprinopsis marcescibilis]